jgi:hypothetical protein
MFLFRLPTEKAVEPCGAVAAISDTGDRILHARAEADSVPLVTALRRGLADADQAQSETIWGTCLFCEMLRLGHSNLQLRGLSLRKRTKHSSGGGPAKICISAFPAGFRRTGFCCRYGG